MPFPLACPITPPGGVRPSLNSSLVRRRCADKCKRSELPVGCVASMWTQGPRRAYLLSERRGIHRHPQDGTHRPSNLQEVTRCRNSGPEDLSPESGHRAFFRTSLTCCGGGSEPSPLQRPKSLSLTTMRRSCEKTCQWRPFSLVLWCCGVRTPVVCLEQNEQRQDQCLMWVMDAWSNNAKCQWTFLSTVNLQ